MASTSNDLEGTRGHLTPEQTRILYKLWQRFFRLCEIPAGYATFPTTDTTSTSANTSVPNSGNGNLPTPCSSSGTTDGKQAGPSSPMNERRSLQETRASPPSSGQNNDAESSRENLASTTTAMMTPSASYAYGKPIQRHPSRSRQIDDRGSHIPKDDKVKDELKTIEEAKEMREFLERYGGEKLREIFWDMVKGEHPDAIMLRFLKARKWDIDRAIAVIGSTAAFRADHNIRSIVKGGELEFTRTRGARKLLTNGISYVYGATAAGEPIYFIEVGNHFSHNQTQEELKRGVILLQEWLQMLMPPPVERKVVIFNMNDFGIRNMDWWCVFFMVKTMESYYVETLAKVYVHNPPWIFRPIWAILKPLLDPVVRDKVRLTSSAEDLAEHIPFDHLPKKSMRGGMEWEFEYPPPEEGENDMQKDTDTFNKYNTDFHRYAREFELATKEVCQLYTRSSLIQRARDGAHQNISSDEAENDDDGDEGADDRGISNRHAGTSSSAENAAPRRRPVLRGGSTLGSSFMQIDEIGSDLKAKRDVIATRLRVAFLKLKPYVIGKSMHDRWDVIRDDGSIHWQYPKADGEVETQTLGIGTTLPELQRNLSLIDDAQNQQAQEAAAKAAAAALAAAPARPTSQVSSAAAAATSATQDGPASLAQDMARSRSGHSRRRMEREANKSNRKEIQEQQQQQHADIRPGVALASSRPATGTKSTSTSAESNPNSNSTITAASTVEPMKDNSVLTPAERLPQRDPSPVPVHPLGAGLSRLDG